MIIIIINFTADTANDYPKSFKVSAILNTPQVNMMIYDKVPASE